MRIGILTSGGDCPGLNAVIRGAVLKSGRAAARKTHPSGCDAPPPGPLDGLEAFDL